MELNYQFASVIDKLSQSINLVVLFHKFLLTTFHILHYLFEVDWEKYFHFFPFCYLINL